MRELRIGDRVASSLKERVSYDWHGRVTGFKVVNGVKLVRVFWAERVKSNSKRVSRTPEITSRPEDLRLLESYSDRF